VALVAYAIELFFDEQADTAVRRLWHRLAASGLPSLETLGHCRHRPHVSLTVLETARLPAVADVEDLVDARRLPALRFSALGTFGGGGGVLFLAPVMTAPLLAVHVRLNDVMQERGIVQWPHYLPGSWVPHCTLAMNVTPAELSAAAGMLAGFRQIQAEVAEVGITDTETGDITVLNR
jgi:hypothetical protein